MDGWIDGSSKCYPDPFLTGNLPVVAFLQNDNHRNPKGSIISTGCLILIIVKIKAFNGRRLRTLHSMVDRTCSLAKNEQIGLS